MFLSFFFFQLNPISLSRMTMNFTKNSCVLANGIQRVVSSWWAKSFFFFEYKCNRCCKNRFDFTDEKILQIQIEQSSLLPRSRAQQRAKSATLRYRDTVTGSNGGRLQNDFNQRWETMESKNNKRRWNTSNDDAVDRDGYIRAENAGTLAKILQERGDRFSIFSLQCFLDQRCALKMK